MRDAAEAKAALQGMQDAVRAESAAEVAGATQAAAARQKDTTAIQQEAQALSQLASSAKATNTQLLYGGRNDMTQHLSDMAQELNYTTLLNRQRWLGFSSVQQAMSYRQQMYNLALLENKAHFAGYLTADQYLGFLQRETMQTASLSAAIRDRTSAIGSETSMLLAHANALQGTSQTAGSLGEGLSTVGAYNAALVGLPDTVSTRAVLDDSQAMAQLTAYRAALLGLPHAEATDIVSSATRLGGIPLTGAAERVPVTVTPELSSAGAASRALASEMRQLSAVTVRPKVDKSSIDEALDDAYHLDGVLVGLTYERAEPHAELVGGPEATAEALALGRALHDIPAESHKVIYVDGLAGEVQELEAFTRAFEDIPHSEELQLGLDDTPLEDGLSRAVGELVKASRIRYAFEARLDDTEALAELDVLQGKIVSAEDQGRAMLSLLGQGGASGGGGGGGPPPPRGGAADAGGPGDAAYWAALAAEIAKVDGLMATAKVTTTQAGGALTAMVEPLVASTGGWFGLNSQLRLFGGLLGTVSAWHVVLDFLIEAVAVFLPAIVTLVAGLTAFGVAGSDAGKAVYNRLIAIHTASDALNAVIPPMTGNLEKLHSQVRPQVWQLYGDAIAVVHNKTGLFSQLALATGNVVDRLAARLSVDLMSSSKGLETFLGVGAANLAKLGTFFSNIGQALLAFIKVTQETHVDQIFLSVFVALSQLLLLVTKLPTPLLAAAVGLHAFWLWGGLLATVVLQLLNPLRSLALALGAVSAAEVAGGLGSLGDKASAFEKLKAGLTDIGAGLGAIPARFGLFSKSAGEAATAARDVGVATEAAGVAATDTAAAGGGLAAMFSRLGPALSNPIGLIGVLAVALAGTYTYLALLPDPTQKWVNSLNQALSKATAFTVVSQTVGDLAAVTQQLAKAQATGVGNATELAGAQRGLSTDLGNELSHVGQVSKAYGTDFVGALALLNTAGVKTSDLFSAQGHVWAADLQQVKGLVEGYAAMGQGLTALQNDVSVQLVTSSDQVTAMGKLNKAWDAWVKTVAGAPLEFIALAQGLATFQQDAAVAGASMTGLGKASLTLQNDFQTSYNNVQGFFDAFRNDQALTGQGDFTKFVKDAVASLIPMAGGSKEAAAQISALAQEAGGPATTNIKTLTQWVGNIKDPLKALYDASNQAAIGASSLSQDAARLTTTLQQDLNPAMAKAIFNAHGGQGVFNAFADSLAKSGPSSGATVAAAKNVAAELLAVSGNSSSAKANFVGFAEAMGLNAKQADQLWKQASTHITANLAQVRGDLAKTAGTQANLVKPGEVDTILKSFKDGTFYELTFLAWIPQVQRAMNVVNHDVGQFFAHDIPVAFGVTSHAFMAAWGGMVKWFSQSVPHGFGLAWNNTWRDVAAPVIRGFSDVTSWVARNFDPWWATHGSAVKKIWDAAWQSMRDDALGAWHFIQSDAAAAWHFITGLFTSGFSKDVWKGFREAGAQAWQWLKVSGSAVWHVISQAADSFFGFVEKGAKTAADLLSFAFKGAWATVVALAKIAWDTVVVIVSVAIDLVTGHWHQAWDDIKAYGIQVFNALKSFFNTTFHAIATLAVQLWHIWFGPAAAQFNSNVAQPLNKFFTGTVPGWFNSLARWWSNLWNANVKSFDATVLAPLQKFFTGTVPGWWNSLASNATRAWASVWSGFSKTVLGPLQNFFTGDVPKWWNSFVSSASRAWASTWSGFQHSVLAPIENFFTSTLPSAMWNSLKGGIDHVISGLNTVIGWINAVTSIVGVHIGSISMLAGGGPVRMAHGSVPGTGDEDGTHIIAMGGEYMVRKPARMALQAAYGPDVMDHLNQADSWLGSGSRGNTASQRGGGRGRYASGGGILGNVTNWLGNAAGAVKGAATAAWDGVASAAKDVASFGEQAVFNAMWTTAGVPAQKAMEALGTPGDMGASWLQDVHNGVSTWIAGQTAKATAAAAAAGGPGGPTGSNSANAAEGYRYLLGSLFGGSKIGAAGAVASIDGESNWNPYAQGTGGRGLIGWTPPGTISDAAFKGGMRTQLPAIIQFVNSSGDMGAIASMKQQSSLNTSAQIWGQKVERYGINDVHPAGLAMAASIAGIPNNAAGGIVGYAGGGPVISAVTAATADPDTREAMALGSWLLTRLNAGGTAPPYGEYGAWLLSLARNKGLTKAQAQNAVTAARLVEPAYARGARASTAASWKATPSTAALHAYALASASLGTHWSTPSAGTLASGWSAVQSFLGPAPGQSNSPAPSGDVAAYAADAARLYPAWEGALGPWHALAALKQPKGTSAANWKAWLAQRAVVQNRVNAASTYIAPLFADLKANPQKLTAADWSLADSSVRRLQAAMDVATWAKSAETRYYSPIQSSLAKLEPDIIAAANAWHGIWGTTLTPTPGGGTGGTGGGSGGSGGGGIPGPGSGGGGTGGATVIDLNRLIVGGPASPAVGNFGFGIASGGEVPALSSVAAMFGGGMASGGVVPNLFVPGLSANLSRQLSAATSGQLPRTLSAAAGNRVGLHVDQLNISNPKAEKPSDSITRASNRLAFLGGRGMV